jgi:site-specific DNA-methyltransferase (adenine-specific)
MSRSVAVVKPYYEAGGIAIYHGDALHVLADLALAEDSVDAVITDPPYASGARTEAAKRSSGQMLRGGRFAKPIQNDQMTTQGFLWLMRELLYAVRPLLPEGASILSFIDWRQWPHLLGAVESVNYRVNTMITWDKVSFGMGNGFRQQHELILHASKGTPTVYDRSVGNVLSFPRENNPDHPSPKPLALMDALLRVITDVDGLILDPFMGGGATLRAAKNAGRRALGIEVEERYCEFAAQRLAQEVLAL